MAAGNLAGPSLALSIYCTSKTHYRLFVRKKALKRQNYKNSHLISLIETRKITIYAEYNFCKIITDRQYPNTLSSIWL